MNRPTSLAVKWKWCALVSVTMVLLSLIPQINLWILRGRAWNGVYVISQGDEVFYSAYVNALINGRTRKNDPFGARDDSISQPLPESVFSIQFLPAYAVALPARILGISASTTFIVLVATGALFASLCVFWLLEGISAESRFSAAATLFILCFGCIRGGHGIFQTFLDINPAAFPFLRRYQPSVPFPFFFVFQLLVWRGLTSELTRRTRALIIGAGLTLTVLIFSYLYLWTAAAA